MQEATIGEVLLVSTLCLLPLCARYRHTLNTLCGVQCAHEYAMCAHVHATNPLSLGIQNHGGARNGLHK